MDVMVRLRELGRNLYWTWHPEVVEIFRDIEPDLWRQVNHNPVEFLDRIPEKTLRSKVEELTIEARVSQAYHHMEGYLRSQDTWGGYYAGALHARPVAYFSAEFGLHESLPTYAGGLGVLAGDHLKSASDLGVPIIAVGLFYAKGYFTQRLDASGWQKRGLPRLGPEQAAAGPRAGPLGSAGAGARGDLQRADPDRPLVRVGGPQPAHPAGHERGRQQRRVARPHRPALRRRQHRADPPGAGAGRGGGCGRWRPWAFSRASSTSTRATAPSPCWRWPAASWTARGGTSTRSRNASR